MFTKRMCLHAAELQLTTCCLEVFFMGLLWCWSRSFTGPAGCLHTGMEWREMTWLTQCYIPSKDDKDKSCYKSAWPYLSLVRHGLADDACDVMRDIMCIFVIKCGIKWNISPKGIYFMLKLIDYVTFRCHVEHIGENLTELSCLFKWWMFGCLNITFHKTIVAKSWLFILSKQMNPGEVSQASGKYKSKSSVSYHTKKCLSITWKFSPHRYKNRCEGMHHMIVKFHLCVVTIICSPDTAEFTNPVSAYLWRQLV